MESKINDSSVTENLLIGETVQFHKNIYEQHKGLVMGVGIMKVTPYDVFPTTCYSIMVDKGEIIHIPYHQIIGVVEPDEVFLELLIKEGDTIQVNFPKYEKPEHPKGWSVDNTTNNDLPF